MRVKQLRGLVALTSRSREKYRLKQCNGDEAWTLGLAVMHN